MTLHRRTSIGTALVAMSIGCGTATAQDASRITAVTLYPGSATVERSARVTPGMTRLRSEEHTSELQSRVDLVCRLLLEKKKTVGANRASRRHDEPPASELHWVVPSAPRWRQTTSRDATCRYNQVPAGRCGVAATPRPS